MKHNRGRSSRRRGDPNTRRHRESMREHDQTKIKKRQRATAVNAQARIIEKETLLRRIPSMTDAELIQHRDKAAGQITDPKIRKKVARMPPRVFGKVWSTSIVRSIEYLQTLLPADPE